MAQNNRQKSGGGGDTSFGPAHPTGRRGPLGRRPASSLAAKPKNNDPKNANHARRRIYKGGWVGYHSNIMIVYRPARIDDLDPISHFTDWWISGRGKARNVPGTVNDCFITKKQHTKYIEKYVTMLAFRGVFIVGWAVKANNDTLIHLLVAGPHRGKGIGKAMVLILQPKFVRSKSDQSTGNPIGFYEKLGFTKMRSEKGKARFNFDSKRSLKASNIDVFVQGHD